MVKLKVFRLPSATGVSLSITRSAVVMSVMWATDLIWEDDTTLGKMYMLFGLLSHEFGGCRSLSLIVGPLKISAMWISKRLLELEENE